MGSDYSMKEVQLFGKTQTFCSLSGVVVKREQRSDTIVSGSGKSGSYGGYGGGSVSIGSSIRITTNLWIKCASGVEHHIQLDGDYPAIEGNVVHMIDMVESRPSSEDYVFDEATRTSKPASYTYHKIDKSPVIFYNGTQKNMFFIGGLKLHEGIVGKNKINPMWFLANLLLSGSIGYMFYFFNIDPQYPARSSVPIGLITGFGTSFLMMIITAVCNPKEISRDAANKMFSEACWDHANHLDLMSPAVFLKADEPVLIGG